MVRNIKLSGRYEPIVVRPHPAKQDFFQIINGHHRCKALAELGYKAADCVVWDVDDAATDILLATLNRLTGSDELSVKLKLLKRLNERMKSSKLSKLLPLPAKQIDRLVNLKRPTAPPTVNAKSFAQPLVFFVNAAQLQIVGQALSKAKQTVGGSAAKKRAAALATIANEFIKSQPNHPPAASKRETAGVSAGQIENQSDFRLPTVIAVKTAIQKSHNEQ